jgi:hypothetical protein
MMRERVAPRLPEPKIGWLDRLCMWAAPEYGARRIAVRRQLAAAEYVSARLARIEAADSTVSRGDRWLTSRLSPNSQLEQDQQTD